MIYSFITYITIITHLLQLNKYKMNIETNLLEEHVNFVENTKKRNKKLCICTTILVFILFILTIIRVFRYLNEKQFLFTTNTKNKQS